MSTRSILGFLYTVQGLAARGITTSDILAAHGLDLNKLDPNGQISRDRELQLLAELFARVQGSSIGLSLGGSFGLAGYGPFTMLLMTAANVFEACKAGIQYQKLTYLYGELSMQIEGSRVGLCITPSHLPEGLQRFLIDRDLAGMYRLLKDMSASVNEPMDLDEVWLPYPEPADSQVYQKYFACKVRFGQSGSALWLKNPNLGRAFPQANPMAFRLYQQQCDQLLHQQQQSSSGSLAERIREYLQLYDNGLPRLADVCVNMGIPERTLRRKLSAQHTSYQQLVDEVRQQKALHWLQHSEMSIERIAEKLGYAEAAAFNHAFQRWTGKSPRAVRKQNRS
ncbi:MAG: AraC family transcriptional regulator [Oceanospirillaceae bacterium]|nr:AraC family transcriptional regulator [Oceanospirillaceae bacterium]